MDADGAARQQRGPRPARRTRREKERARRQQKQQDRQHALSALSPEQRQTQLDSDRAAAEEQRRRLEGRTGQPVVVDLQGLDQPLNRAQLGSVINQLKALYSTVANSRNPCALTVTNLLGAQPEAPRAVLELQVEPEPEPEPEATLLPGLADPLENCSRAASAGGSLRSGLRAMGAENWRGVLFELSARPSDLHNVSNLVYIDALAPAALDEIPQWFEPGVVLVLRPDVPELELPPVPTGAHRARLPLEMLLPSSSRPAKRTRAHTTATQMQAVVAALDHYRTCGCWRLALASAVPPSKQRALLAPAKQRYANRAVPIDSYRLTAYTATHLEAGAASCSEDAPTCAATVSRRFAGVSEGTVPMVSALCVSKLSSLQLLRRAVECFERQDWPSERRELLLLFDSASSSAAAVAEEWGQRRGVRLLPVDESRHSLSLGELRQLSVEAAKGEFIVQWDDDDWYHSSRITKQMEAVAQGGDDCVASMMREWVLVVKSAAAVQASDMGARGADQPRFPATADNSVVAEHALAYCETAVTRVGSDGSLVGTGVVCCSPWWPGSLLCKRDAMPAYTAMRKGEDTAVAQALLRRAGLGVACMSGTAGLYVYEHHGDNNTWGSKHFQGLINTYGVAELSLMHLAAELGYTT
jgi:hypothetical protein